MASTPADAAMAACDMDEAIAWAVRLGSGTATEADHAQCQHWRHSHPRHEAAWQQVAALQGEFSQLHQSSPGLLYQTLATRQPLRSGRRQAIKLLGMAAVALCGGWWAWRSQPQWVVDEVFHTAIGQQQRHILADGSTLWLNTGSRVALRLTPFSRSLTLLDGEMHLQTGHDADSLLGKRPLQVITRDATLIPVGTAFGVRLHADSTRLTVSQGKVIIRRSRLPDSLAQAGGSYRMARYHSAILPLLPSALSPDGWTQGVLEVREMLLADFVTELARYSQAPLLCDPAIADLRLSGVFQLSGPEPVPRVLAALTLSLPVQVQRQGSGWVVQARR